MKQERFSLRTVATDPVSTAKRTDLPVLEEPVAVNEAAEASAPAPQPEAAPEPAPAPTPRARKKVKTEPKTERPATRLGARGVTVWVDPSRYRAIKIAGLDLGMTTQDLMMEAIDLYLSHQQRSSKTT